MTTSKEHTFATGDAPDVEDRKPARRWVTVVRLLAGWALLFLGGVLTFTTVETTEEPVVRCGSMALRVMFDTSEAPAGRGSECQGEAAAQVGGGTMIFTTPGLLLVGGPALGRRLRRGHAAEDAEMERTGVWRFYRFWRTAAAVVGFAPVTLFFLAGLVTTEVVLLAIAAAFGGPWALYCYLNVLRPRVVFEPAGALVVNPWKTRLISWGSIVGVEPDYWGATVTLRGGEVVNVWVGQKTNWARWRGTRSRADALAAAMANRAGDWTPDGATPFVTDPVSVAERRLGRRNLVFGLLAAAVLTAIRIALGW